MPKVYPAERLADAIAENDFDNRTAELAARALLVKLRADRLAFICANPDDDRIDSLLDLEERLNARGGYDRDDS